MAECWGCPQLSHNGLTTHLCLLLSGFSVRSRELACHPFPELGGDSLPGTGHGLVPRGG